MRIVFVMGPSCGGKSFYIKENFKDTIVIDLLNFQKSKWVDAEIIMKSYEDCKKALVNAIKNNPENKDIILEHTLLKGIRRKMYIDAVKEVTDIPIEIVCIIPPWEIMQERYKLRGIDKRTEEFFNDCVLSVYEEPTLSEGFSSIKIIKD